MQFAIDEPTPNPLSSVCFLDSGGFEQGEQGKQGEKDPFASEAQQNEYLNDRQISRSGAS